MDYHQHGFLGMKNQPMIPRDSISSSTDLLFLGATPKPTMQELTFTTATIPQG